MMKKYFSIFNGSLMISMGFVLFLFLFPGLGRAGQTLDPEFAENGVAVRDFGIGDDEIFAMAVQEDGKILVAGYSSNGAVRTITVSRYLQEGKPDIQFNYDGVFTYSFGNGDSTAHSLVVLDDGRIAVLCSGYEKEPFLALFILSEDGYPDSAFGENGLKTLAVDGEKIVSADLKMDDDGDFLLGATAVTADAARSFLFRLLATGEEDRNFGENGVVVVGDRSPIWLNSLACTGDGKIFVGGGVELDGTRRAAIWQFNEDGSPDGSFGRQGESLPEIGGVSSIVRDLYYGEDKRLLVAGTVGEERESCAFVLRLNGDDPDNSYTYQKLFRSDLGYETQGLSVSMDGGGNILLAGIVVPVTEKDAILWTIQPRPLLLKKNKRAENSEEPPVVSQIITDLAGADDASYAVVPLLSGKILVAGSTVRSGNKNFFLARYTNDGPQIKIKKKTAQKGVITEGYRVQTLPVTDITRIGGVSGGIISDSGRRSCPGSCVEECGETKSSCYTECLTKCGSRPTVKLRGVCFGLKSAPQFNEKQDEKETAPSGASVISIFGEKVSRQSFLFDLVRSGQTEDGSGTGAYQSTISEITPGMTYYLRAYGVLSDGKVIYGNEVRFTTDDACFIATAAYGSTGAWCVSILRTFRDTFLMTSGLGRKIVGTYYHLSPPVASIIRQSFILQVVVQILLYPGVLFALFMVKTSLVVKYLTVSLAFISAGAVYIRGNIGT